MIWNLSWYIILLVLAVDLAILAKHVVILELGLRSISKRISCLIFLNIYTPPEHTLTHIILFSLKLSTQAVIGGNLKFLDTATGYPGSIHDARILRDSAFYIQAERNILLTETTDVTNGYKIRSLLIGDRAYSASTWLVKLFPNNFNISQEQKKFKMFLSSARVAVEGAFGILNARWRCLLNCIFHTAQIKTHYALNVFGRSSLGYMSCRICENVKSFTLCNFNLKLYWQILNARWKCLLNCLHHNIENLSDVIISCCVLHNICQIKGDSYINNGDVLKHTLQREWERKI